MKKVLSIAGSDCSGGAGIQADLKTMTALGVYGMSVITAITAQNTTGVYGIMEVSADFVAKQLDCVFNDIRPDAVKIGMVSNAEIIEVIASKLTEHGAVNIVVDPVMISTSGSKLLNGDALEALKRLLLPIACVITPNIPEAEVLSGVKISGREEMLPAAKMIVNDIKKSLLIKGGHLNDCADDLLYTDSGEIYWLPAKRVANNNTHGTGCTLSSAVACRLALGDSIVSGVRNAKDYVTGALLDGLDIGSGSGPLNHCYLTRSV